MLMFTYQTSRLSVIEVFSDSMDTEILVSIIELLTANVVASLPAYFQNITSILDAQVWYKKMLSESRLFVVRNTDTHTIIGFVFVYVENNEDAHIGYLLGESNWGKGYATEILNGLIDFIKHENKIKRLIAGVASNNIVSSRLLHKLGFVRHSGENNDTVFYYYQLPQT